MTKMKIALAAQRVEQQNNAIRSAILFLKEITHRPLDTGEAGLTDGDREKVRTFIDFLASKEIGMEQLIDIVNE